MLSNVPSLRACLGLPARFQPAMVLALILMALPAPGDQVQMRNGDRFSGKVVTLSSNVLVLENSVVGTLRLPRTNVHSILLGSPIVARPSTNAPFAPAEPTTEAAASLDQLKGANLSGLSPEQLLSTATPEAQAKFKELMGGFLTGRLTESDIRKEAKSVAAQVRALQSDLGPEVASALEGYLAILDKFLNETAPAAPAPQPPPSPQPTRR